MTQQPRRSCPICGKPAQHAHQPFCSDRCRQVDLNRWLSEGYAIPGPDDESDVSGGTDPN